MNMLTRECEMFYMRENEYISSMYIRFTNIINSLHALDKTYSNSDLVRKILRCLPKSWMPKVTVIEEAKNLNELLLEELLKSLMTYEMIINLQDEDEEKELNKKKIIASKSKEDSDEESDGDMTLITRRYNKFLAKNKLGGKFFKKGQYFKQESRKEGLTCFECNKPRHFKN
ncbi:UBN2 domain-containing protein [Cephalotus follicularis]|uniref:UBN2 domain-containing protein n=1 Tax=Cephalotus follicularis TaxID=3775 RepID=A0A1Q3B1P0_CEPFO|nr:UBN2 domain-containing protein [Cephalotus follicularis]